MSPPRSLSAALLVENNVCSLATLKFTTLEAPFEPWFVAIKLGAGVVVGQ